MPIRASVLRRPASNAARRFATASSAVSSSAPREPAVSIASSTASHGTAAVAPAARAIAREWTSRMSAASTRMSDRPRRPASVSAVFTAPTARTDGIGSRVAENERSDRTRSSVRPRAARDGGDGEALEGGLESAWPGGRIPGRIEPGDPARERVEQRVEIGDDRPVEAQRPRPAGGPRRPAEQRRAPPEVDPHVHDRPLALRVDRRVRHLGERLAEVVRDRPIDAGEPRRRRVVAHRPERLVAVEDHRLDVEARLLRVEAGEVAERRGRPVGRPRAQCRRGRAAARRGSAAAGGGAPSRRRLRGPPAAAGRRGASPPGPAARGGPCPTARGGSPRLPTRRRRAGRGSRRRPPVAGRCGP